MVKRWHTEGGTERPPTQCVPARLVLRFVARGRTAVVSVSGSISAGASVIVTASVAFVRVVVDVSDVVGRDGAVVATVSVAVSSSVVGVAGRLFTFFCALVVEVDVVTAATGAARIDIIRRYNIVVFAAAAAAAAAANEDVFCRNAAVFDLVVGRGDAVAAIFGVSGVAGRFFTFFCALGIKVKVTTATDAARIDIIRRDSIVDVFCRNAAVFDLANAFFAGVVDRGTAAAAVPVAVVADGAVASTLPRNSIIVTTAGESFCIGVSGRGGTVALAAATAHVICGTGAAVFYSCC